jgi:hypothetical protein
MATLQERFKMRRDEVLRQKATAAVHTAALALLRAGGGSTAQQKADALKRLQRDVDDKEWFIIVMVLGVTYSATPSDTEIQTGVDSVYAQLPGP